MSGQPRWTWRIVAGELLDPAGAVVGHGYSGHGDGVNNPALCQVQDVGPIPVGLWRINQAMQHPRLGPVAMPLAPVDAETHGRFAFYIHGDNGRGDRSASHGCIVLPRAVREAVQASTCRNLWVTAE